MTIHEGGLRIPVKNRDYHKKLYRLVRILNKLETEGKVSPRELAEEFNVSMRTAQRDIELVNMAEFPLISSSKGNYSFMPGFSLKRLPLSSEEASLLAFLSEIAKDMGGNFVKSFKSLHSKLVMTAKGKSPFHAITPITSKQELPVMTDLREAIEESLKVEIRHLNKKNYLVKPLKLIYSEGFWYLYAQIDGRKYCTSFRVDRITSVERSEEKFVPPKNLEKMLQSNTSIWFGPERNKKALLRISGEVAHYFESASYFPFQKIKRTEKDGSLLLETQVSHFMEVIPVILKWIPYIKVIKPRQLRDEIRETIREYTRTL